MANVITNGSYNDFKLCAFRALDCARVAECVNAFSDWSLILLFKLSLLTETLEDGAVRLTFSYDFMETKSVVSVDDTFMMLAGKTDTQLVGINGGSKGTVTFLLEVP